MSSARAVEAFAAAAAVPITGELAARIESVLATCSREHPDIAVDACGFARYLGQRAASGTLPAEPVLLDLHLAFAAAHGDAAAIARFERDTLSAATAALRALRVDEIAIDEIVQGVRGKLLVGDSPRLLEYRGDGRLRAWVRVIAIRDQLMAQRGRRVDLSLSDAMLAVMPDPADDPALAVLRHHYREDLAAALTTAIAALEVRDRSLLRYSLVDGLELGAIASIFQTHKSTISRWLARARERLWRRTRDALTGGGGMTAADVESLVRAVRSGLDLSLERLLGDA